MIIFFPPDGIGDTLMAVPALRRLIAVRGAEHVSVLVSSDFHRTMLRQFLGDAVHVIVRYDGKRFPHLRLFVRLFLTRSDAIFAPMLSRRWTSLLFFAFLCKRTLVPRSFFQRTPTRIRSSAIALESFNGHQVNFFVQFSAEYEPRMDNSPVAFEELAPMKPRSSPPPSAHPRAWRVAVGINCGLRERHKLPSPEFFARLLSRLAKGIDIELLVVGSPADMPLIEQMQSHLDPLLMVRFIIGLPVDELIDHLRTCDLGITGTTGQGHMMAAAGIPMLITAGVTNPFESGPYVRRAAILKHHFACGPCYQESYRLGCGKILCMETLNVDEGVGLALRLLQDMDFGDGWLNRASKQEPVLVENINKIHRLPVDSWISPKRN